MILVAIADDHRVVRVGLEQLLGTFDDVEFVGAAAGGEEAVPLARPSGRTSCCWTWPCRTSTASRSPGASPPGPETRVVLFTSFSDRERIVAALDAGAIGYLLKDAEPQDIHKAIRAAARGEAPLAPKAAAALLAERAPHASGTPELTGREREVLALVLDGMANKQIARRLGISEKTVKGHLTNVFQRIGVADRTQAALWAERNGLFRGPGTEVPL